MCGIKINEGKAKKYQRFSQSCSAMLLPSSTSVNKMFSDDILSKMKPDKIFYMIRNDRMLIDYGSRLYKRLRCKKHLYLYVSQKIREMARFFKAAKEVDNEIESLKQLFDPKKYKTCVNAVQTLAGFDKEKNRYKIPSIARKIGADIRKCAEILRSQHLLANNNDGINSLNSFLSYFDVSWTEDVSVHALRTEEERHWNKLKLIPLIEDIKKFNSYLRENIMKLKSQLIENPSNSVWTSLAKLTLAHVLIFNRKRVAEAQRLYTETLDKATSAPMDEDVKSCLSELEVKLAETLTRLETRATRNRRVPILLTLEMKNSLDLLVDF